MCPRLHCNPKDHKKREKTITTLRNVIAQKEKENTPQIHCIALQKEKKKKKERKEEEVRGRINLGEELGFKLGSSN